MDESKTPRESIKKTKRGHLLPVMIIPGSLAVIFAGIIILLTYNPTYTHFSKKRIQKIEERFSITVTEDIRLVQYDEIEFLTQLDYTLKITDIGDPREFMRNNVRGRIISEETNSSVFDMVIHAKHPGQLPVASYKYENNEGYIVQVDFYDTRESCTAILSMHL